MLCRKRKYNVKSEKYFTRWTVLDIILVSRSLSSSDREDKKISITFSTNLIRVYSLQVLRNKYLAQYIMHRQLSHPTVVCQAL